MESSRPYSVAYSNQSPRPCPGISSRLASPDSHHTLPSRYPHLVDPSLVGGVVVELLRLHLLVLLPHRVKSLQQLRHARPLLPLVSASPRNPVGTQALYVPAHTGFPARGPQWAWGKEYGMKLLRRRAPCPLIRAPGR
jgi:hypothetical protein